MKTEQRIDMNNGNGAYRCKLRPVLAGGLVTWEMDPLKQYDVLQAYRLKPHIQFSRAGDDAALVDFIRTWGPLWSEYPDVTGLWVGTEPIEAYRAERDHMNATLRLFQSLKNATEQRSALLNVADILWSKAWHGMAMPPHIAVDPHITSTAVFLKAYLRREGFTGDPREWCHQATAAQIGEACAALIHGLRVNGQPTLTVAKAKGRRTVQASLQVRVLVDALWWMVWQDVFQQRPFPFCEECGTLILSGSARARKYCSVECARRKTGREWIRGKRERERAVEGIQQ